MAFASGGSNIMGFEPIILDILRKRPCVSTNTKNMTGQPLLTLYPSGVQFSRESHFGMISGVKRGPLVVSSETMQYLAVAQLLAMCATILVRANMGGLWFSLQLRYRSRLTFIRRAAAKRLGQL